MTHIMKKATLTLIVFSLLANVSMPANAGAEIRGAPSCGDWVTDHREKGILFIGDTNWLMGFLSGIAYSSHQDFIKETTNESLYLWVDNFCQANPHKNLGDAGNALAKKLIKEKHL